MRVDERRLRRLLLHGQGLLPPDWSEESDVDRRNLRFRSAIGLRDRKPEGGLAIGRGSPQEQELRLRAGRYRRPRKKGIVRSRPEFEVSRPRTQLTTRKRVAMASVSSRCRAAEPRGSPPLCPPALLLAAFVISFSSHSGVNGRHDVIMKKSLVLLTLGFSVTVAAFAQQAAKNDFDGKTWWDYVKVLADDNMEGRETGSAGLKRAEAYVVEQLKADGVEPAGTDGYYQPVKFEVRQIVEKDSSIALIRDGKSEPLTLGEDAFFNTRVNLAPEIEASLVFVGYGLDDSREKLRRSRRFRSERQGRGDIRRLARGNAHGARVALSICRRALESAAKSRRDRASSHCRIPPRWIFPGRAWR